MITRWLFCGLIWSLPLATASTAIQAAEKEVSGETLQTLEDIIKPPLKKQRLRFKSGPVCACGSGLTEKDIRNSEIKRFKALANQTK